MGGSQNLLVLICGSISSDTELGRVPGKPGWVLG